MKNVIAFPDKGAIEEAAALWLVKIDQGELSDEHKQQLRVWLDHDPHHREALARMAHVWGEMDALNQLAQLFPLEAGPNPKPAKVPRATKRWFQPRPLTMLFAVATSASLVLGVFIALKQSSLFVTIPTVSEPVELIYQTELGKQAQIELKDGSLVTLNTRSKLHVRFTENERSIYLDSGEAHFDVAKNPHRPFVVYAGTGEVRAVGTAFSVRMDSKQDVDVMVSEGTVQVLTNVAAVEGHTPKGAPAATSKPQLTTLTLKKGGVVTYREAIEAYAYVAPKVLSQKLAWTNGKWIFDGETLTEVIAEANRYSNQKIQIDDPALANLRVGGYFNAGDIEALLAALETGFNIKVRRSDGLIQLSSLSISSAPE